ncbi:LON peptidase substrate-binding domain-containing protein [Frateuria aurantia]
MRTTPTPLEIPLFPLAAVFFPGGQLSLRIFEPRYLDMIKECSRQGRGFGICLILEGEEAGLPAAPAAIGTMAEILDFQMGSDGLLQITVAGRERFRVVQTRIRADGLILASVDRWPASAPQSVPVEFSLLQQIARRLLEVIGEPAAEQPQRDLDEAERLGFRLAQWLPLTNEERQQLLEQPDPLQRLHDLNYLLPRFQRE